MNTIDRLNEIESLYYQHKLKFDLSNTMFLFKEHDDTLIAYLNTYFENEDLELKKLALYITFVSSVLNKELQYNLFETVFLFENPDIESLYLSYLKEFEDESIENFLYVLITKLREQEVSFFIKVLTSNYTTERVTLAFFILETYTLKDEDIMGIYKYLFSQEDNSITTVEDFYNNSKLVNDFTDSLKGREVVKLKYEDIEKKDSLLKKRLNKTGSVAYFFNEEIEEYQVWVKLSLVQVRSFEAVTDINFNASIDFPRNLLLYFLFSTEHGDTPFSIDLFFGNISDTSFIKYILKNKKINFIFVSDDFIPIKSFDFVFSGPVLYKLINKAWLSYKFKDFEWLRVKDAIEKIETGDYLQIDIPISIFRKIHLDISIFQNIFNQINISKSVEHYVRALNPIFYTQNDLDKIPAKELESIVKDYIVELDKHFPYLILFLSNNNNSMLKYMSYLLKEDFTEADIKSEVVKRIVFIAGYLNSRDVIYYNHVKKIAKAFKIELTDQFMNKLSDSFETKEERNE